MANPGIRFPDTVIRASAGTGKTFQLSNRYLGLLQAEVPPDQILASTFARKAAGEILERVLLRLADAAASDEGCARFSADLATEGLSRAECAAHLEQVVRQLHRLRIGTLDSFFIKTAGSFALEFGLPGGWTILEDLDDRQLKQEAIRRLLRHDAKSAGDLSTLLGLLQKGESARDIIGGLLSTVDDFHGLFLESQPEAWIGETRRPERTEDELTEFREILANVPLPGDKRFGTARDKALAAMDQKDWQAFLQTGLASRIFPERVTYFNKEIPEDVCEAFLPLIEHAQAVLVNQILQQTAATYRLLERYDAIYRPLKFERHAFRFDDITRLLADNLETAPLPQVEFRLDSAVHHMLLDEFQDTSRIQWQVLRRFAHDVNDQPDKTFFCVGDVKQAIYGWRGGISEIFDRVATDLRDLQELPLDKSYRSAPTIIEFVNEVFGSLSRNPSLERWPDVCHTWRTRFSPHTTARTEYPGYCEIRTFPEKDKEADDKQIRARLVAAQVAELHARHPGCTIGVLTRTNATVGRIIHALRNPGSDLRAPILASEEGGNPLTDAACVIYILSAMKLAAHPGDGVARFNVAHSPLARCFELNPTDWDQRGCERVARQIRAALVRDGYGRTIERWVGELAADCDERELNRLNQLVEVAYLYESRSTLDPTDFVRFIEETRVENPSESLVRVMNVHQSKGLQFDLVVLPELEAQFIRGGTEKYLVERASPTEPVSRVLRYFSQDLLDHVPEWMREMHRSHQNRIINETLCVLYVALTRAVHALHIVVPVDGKSESSTAARLLLNAVGMAAPPAESVVYQLGDPDWISKWVPDALEAEPLPEPADMPPIRLAPPGPVRRRNLNYVTPSSQGGARLTPQALLPEEVSLARARGSLIHAWCEQIEWLDENPPDADLLTSVAGRFARPGLDLPAELRWFDGKIRAGEFAENLTSIIYRTKIVPQLFRDLAAECPLDDCQFEVLCERRLTFRNGDDLVNGTADRLVLVRYNDQIVAADVIDFKTDTVQTDADVEHLRETYREQLRLYRLAIAAIYRVPEERIAARLALVSASRVVSVD